MRPVELSQAPEAYVRGIDDCFALVGAHPAIGAEHDTVRTPVRTPPHGSHRIYYDVLPDRIVVRRVLHKPMNLERWLWRVGQVGSRSRIVIQSEITSPVSGALDSFAALARLKRCCASKITSSASEWSLIHSLACVHGLLIPIKLPEYIS